MHILEFISANLFTTKKKKDYTYVDNMYVVGLYGHTNIGQMF